LSAGSTAALAQTPAVTSVVNAASGVATVAAGGGASIFGSNLGPASAVTSSGGQTNLGGTSVKIGGYNAILYSSGAGQVNIQIPWELAGQSSASLTVTFNGASSPFNVTLATVSPGLYTQNSTPNGGPGIIYNPNGNLNASNNAAAPGSIVQIAATGLGPVVIQQADGQAPSQTNVSTTNPVTVSIGGQPATVVSAVLCVNSPACTVSASTYLIAAIVPNVSGSAVNVQVTQGAANSNTVTMNVGAPSLTINSGPNFGSFQMGPVQLPLQASGGTGAGYTWSVVSGSLPTGMGLHSDGGPNYFSPGVTNGLIGVATAPGVYTFTLQVTDSANNPATLPNCTIKILSLAITDPNQLTDGMVGASYSYPMTATGATGNVTWSAPNGLPPGMSINSSTGVITGPPTQAGNYGYSINAQDSTGTTSRFFNIQVFAVVFTNNGNLGLFNQGSSVNLTLGATGGTLPYTFSSGNLPPGLSLNSSTGALSGTLTGGGGTYRFSATVKDQNGFSYNRNFVLNIVGVPTLPGLNVAYPIEDVTVGESRNFPLSVNGGIPPYTWTVTNGTLPSGMRLLTGNSPSGAMLPSSFNQGPNDGVITGAPNTAPPGGGTVQSFTFTVSVTDSTPSNQGGPFTTSRPITLLETVLTLNTPPNPIRGVPYTGYIQPVIGISGHQPQGAVNWNILSGTLPAGLNPPTNSTTGVGPGFGTITGTPTANASSNVFMEVICCAGLDFVHRYIGFNIQSPTIPSITVNGTPGDAFLNQSNYSYGFAYCCTSDPVTFSSTGTPPPGLTVSSNGQLSGTPTATGQYTFQVIARDNLDANNFGETQVTVNVAPFQIANPGPGNVGTAYTGAVSITGGTGPYTFTATQGTQLPPGLTFNSDGTFSGTPTSAGMFQINYSVTDNASHTFRGGFTVNLYPAARPGPPTFNFGPNLGAFSIGELQYGLTASGGNGTYTWSVPYGSLPPGILLRTDGPFPSYFNGATAGLIGVSTTPGTYNFTVAVASNGQTSYEYCTLRVVNLTLMDGYNLPQAFVSQSYTYPLTALDPAPVTGATFTVQSGLPPGIGISSSGAITGAPTTAGTYNIQLQIAYNGDTIGRTITMRVSAVRFTTPAVLANVTAGAAVNMNFQAAGGSGSYTFTSPGLPNGLALNNNGNLTGTWNAGVGRVGFAIVVTDSNNSSIAYSQNFSIDGIGSPALLPAINMNNLTYSPITAIGSYMSWTVSVQSGGAAPFTWNITGLPPGISFRTSAQSELNYMVPGDVEIWGVPTSLNGGNPYNLTITVTDANGSSATVNYPLYISALAVDGNDYPPNGTLGTAYFKQLRVLGGTPPYTVGLINPSLNTLPAGVSLDTNAFTLSGTPAENGNFYPDFQFNDSAGNSLVMEPGIYIATAGSSQITINNYTYLGNAVSGQQYNQSLNACCAANAIFNWALVSGSMPAGLTLNTSTGAISGTPSGTTGKYVFLVSAADPAAPSNKGYKQFTLNLTPLYTTNSGTGNNNAVGNVPWGTVNQPYSYPIPVSGGTASLTFALQPNSTLPPGITLSSSGLLSGTPTASGQFQFNASITQQQGIFTTAYFNISIYAANSGPAVAITTAANMGTVPIGWVQLPLTAAGGNGTFTWSVTAGSLPPGLALRSDVPSYFPSGAAGILGIATAANSTPYSFTLTATSNGQSMSQAFTLKVTNLVTVDNNGGSLTVGYTGVPYSYSLSALNNNGTVTYSVAGGIPSWLNLSSNGILSGTPAASGSYGFNIFAADSVDKVNIFLNVTIFDIKIGGGASLPNGTQGDLYTPYTFSATGGTGTYSWSATGVPGGMALNTAGMLTGTPNGTGRFYLNVTATASGVSDTRAFALDIVGVPPQLPLINTYGNLDDCTYGVTCERGFQVYDGGIAPFHWQVMGLPTGMTTRSGSANTRPYITDDDIELWGTPLALGTFQVTATVTDSSTPPLVVSQTFPLTVSKLLVTAGPVNGTVNTAYSSTLQIIGGTPAAGNPLYTAQTSPQQLPAGLTLTGMTLGGTSLAQGFFNPQFLFTDQANPANTLHATLGFTINGPNTGLVLNTYTYGTDGGSPNTVIGYYPQNSTINFTLGACCTGPYTWSVTGGNLPAGVTLGSSSGTLSGTVASSNTPGPYTFTVNALNGTYSGFQQYTIFVTSLSVTASQSLPYGSLTQAYSQLLSTATATFTVLPHSFLPPGLALSSSGTVSGTPTSAGQYNFWVQAVSSTNSSDVYVVNFSLAIWNGNPPLFLGAGPTFGPNSAGPHNMQLTATGGAPPQSGQPQYHYSVTPGFVLPQYYRIQDGGQLPGGFSLTSGTGGAVGVVTGAGNCGNVTCSYASSLRVTDSANNTYDRAVTFINSSLTLVNPSNPPSAILNSAYSYTFGETGGTNPYVWSATGLPHGVTIGSSTGTISGTPTAAGSFNIGITVADSSTTAATFNFTLTVYPFAISNGQTLPQGTQGTAYSQTLTAAGCGSGCAWSLQSGSLPNGMSLNSSTGVIAGTPTGQYNNFFTVQAAGSNGTTQRTFSILLAPSTPQPLIVTNNPNLYYSTLGNGYGLALYAQGGTAPYTWSLSAGSLPAGVGLYTSGETLGFQFGPGFTYLIGKPLALGTYTFTLQVTDSASHSATQAFTWNISPLNFNMASFPFNGNAGTYGGATPTPTYGQAYSQPMMVVGGTTPYTAWTTPLATNPLPPGLSIDANGLVSGTPAATGSFSSLIQVTDTASNIFQQFVSFNIVAPTSKTVSFGLGSSIGTYAGGGTYVFNFNPSGGTAPYTLSALTSLPPGCALESGSGLLSNASGSYDLYCSPLGAGPYSFTVKATDSGGNYGVRTFSIVFAPQQLFTNTTLANASTGTAFSQPLVSWDNGGTVTWSVASGSAMPPGMSLDGSTIDGTPGTAGNYSFVLTATDSTTGDAVNYTFGIAVAGVAITTPAIIPTQATVGAPYSLQFNSSIANNTNVTWSATGLPNGLSLSPSGALTGALYAAGAYTLTIKATYNSSTVTELFTLFVRQATPSIFSYNITSSAAPPDVLVGQSYAYALSSNLSGGVPPYTWAVANGSSLPPGLTLVSGANLPTNDQPGLTLLAGLPTAANTYTFALVATDSLGHTVQNTFHLNVSNIGLQAGSLAATFETAAYAAQLTPVGGTPPYTFTYSQGGINTVMFPPGITASSTGLISGTATSSGTFGFYVNLADNAGHHFSEFYSLTGRGPGGLSVTTPLIFGAIAGQPLSNTQLVAAPASQLTWSLVSGAFPPGVSMDTTGLISGIPSAPGTYSYTVRAVDNTNSGNYADRVYPLQVSSMQFDYARSPLVPVGMVGQPFSYRFKVTGASGSVTFTKNALYPMPPGLDLSSSGVLSGTPAQSGVFTLYVTLADQAGNFGYAQMAPVWVLPAGGTPPLLSVGLSTAANDATVGSAYFNSLASVTGGGVGAVTFAVAPNSSLPPGIVIEQGSNGVPSFLGGIPTAAGTYTFVLVATDSMGQTADIAVTVRVSIISVLPKIAPNGTVAQPYSFTFTAAGGVQPFTDFNFTAASGAPPGLDVSFPGGNNIQFSGTPTQAGFYTVQFYLTDSANNTLTYSYAIDIDNAGNAQGIGLDQPNGVSLNYVLTGPAPTAVPIGVTATTTTPTINFTAAVTGIPGLSLTPSSGAAPSTMSLNLNPTGLTAGTYGGVLAVASPTATNGTVAVPVLLTVSNPPPCVYTLIPNGGAIAAAGGSGSFTITTGSLCSWTAGTTSSFIAISPATASGTGSGTVQFTVPANTGSAALSGTITVQGQTFTVTQFGSNCALSISPTSVIASAAGGLATVFITTTNSSCGWTAGVTSPLTFAPGSPMAGTGNGSVTYSLPSNANTNTVVLSGSVTLNGGNSAPFTVTEGGVGCVVGLTAAGAEIGYSGGSGSVNVTTPAGCTYNTVTGPSWISVTFNATGSGPGPLTLSYSVSANSSASSRIGTLTIGGQPYSITQDAAPCGVTVDPTASGSPFGVNGGTGTLAIIANGSNCSWVSSSSASWLTVSPPYGSGATGTVNLSVSSNSGSPTSRSATVTIAGRTVNVTQTGVNCTYTLGSMNATVPYGGGTGAVMVTAPSGCAWNSSNDSSAPWLGSSSGPNSGTSSVVFTAAPNLTAAARSGTLTVAGQPFTVTEAAGPCNYLLSGVSSALSAAGGGGSFSFSTATSGCSTQAVSFTNWLTVSTASTPDGTSGTVTFTAAPNVYGSPRTGTIQFAAQTFTVSETNASCSYSLVSNGLILNSQSGNGDVLGAASLQSCTPAVGTTLPSVVTLGTLQTPGQGSNIFDQPFLVAPYNSTGPGVRLMIITFGGQIFTIKQTSW
jgi:hypothetical protein